MNSFDTVRAALQSLETDHCLSLEGDDRVLGVLTALAQIEADHYSAADMADAQAKAFRAGVASVTAGQEPVAWMHWLHGPVQLFMNKDAAALELERLNQEYPDAARKMRPLVFGDAAPVAQQPNEWREAVLDWLANIGKDFPIDTPPSEIVKWLMDYERELAQQPQAEVKLNYFWIQEYARQHGVDYNELCALVRKVVKAPQQAEAVRPCTCHPDDNPPVPCAKKYALDECKAQQAEAVIDKCSECSKASTKDSMWALYCVECIESKIAPALAADQQPAATVQQRAEGGVEAHLHHYLPIGTKLFAAPQQAEAVPEMHDALCPALTGGDCTCTPPAVIDRAWAQFCGGIGRGPDAPYPGMIEAFEAHYGQTFTDKDWREETGIWAAAWKAAKAHEALAAPQQAEAVPSDVVRDALELAEEALGWHAACYCEESLPQSTVDALRSVRAAIDALSAPQQAEAVPPDVVRDAERYRMIRKLVYIDPLRDILRIAQTYLLRKDGPTVAEQLDAAIDAAIKTTGAKSD